MRAWHRTRPFWAGVLLVLGGAEITASPLSPLPVVVSLGLGGVAAVGIGAALIAAGLFLWFLPHTHHYVGVHAVILSVVSFAATNLGGFLIGMLLGIAGGAMGFAWTPGRPRGACGGRAVETDDPDPGAGRTGEALRPTPPPSGPLAAALPLVLLAGLAVPGAGARAGSGPAPVPRTPPTVTTTRFTPHGLTLAGVTDVPTADGPLRAMVLRMRAASLSDYRLRTRDGGPELALDARELRLSGDVTLYLTRLSGCVQGLLCLTFTPDTLPVPPVSPPFVFMTDVAAEQALVTSGTIDAEGLALATPATAALRRPG